MTDRIGKLQAKLHENEGALITGAADRLYLTGFSSSAGVVFITAKTALLIIDFRYFEKAEKEGKKIMVLAGRPYHVDPEINHGIDKLISSFNVAIVSEDVVSPRVEKFHTNVLNQWTYHSRLYAAAKYVTTRKDMELIQLVSFGCGVDAITTDEVREILEKEGKIYTQIKIDEITNLGAVKIRIRSLLAAIDND